MVTKKIYQDNRNLYILQTEIVDALVDERNKDDLLLVFKETIFFPGGGGQSCDVGIVEILNPDVTSSDDNAEKEKCEIVVSETFEADGEIFHRVKDGASLLKSMNIAPEMKCRLEIDWDRRFDNMQRHCGEHILSGVFYDLYGGVNRGFHMGDDYMTIDISLEDNPEFKDKEVTWDMALAAELRTNEIIWSDLPVVPHHFDTREEASKMPLRKALAIDEDITIVTIGDPSNPADSVACCGTHPHTTGQVGMLKIYKVEPNKGMYRIFFEAGKRALMGYRERFDILSKLEKDLSAGVPDLLEKYRAKQDKQKEVRDRLYHLTKAVIESEQNKILGAAPPQAAKQEDSKDISASTPGYRYSILSLDDLIELGRGLTGKLANFDILFIVHEPTNTLLLFSDSKDCGKLVKENASVFNGKGGGNQTFARAIFNRTDDLDMFIDAVKKLIR